MHCGAMRSKTGHAMSLSDITTMMCVFSANVFMDGGLVVPWVPAAPSGHIELARVPAAAASDPDEKKRECTDISYHRSSHVVRRWLIHQ